MLAPLKKLLIAFVVCLCLYGLWWLRTRGRRTAENQMPRSSETNAAPRPLKPEVPAPIPAIVQPFAKTPYLGLADPRGAEFERKSKANPSWEWDVPIEFFGKVVDEHNLPVPEPSVAIEWVGSPERYGGDGVVHRTLTGGADGLFSISGIQGKCMGVRVSKEGYHTSQGKNSTSFEYAAFFDPTFIEPDHNKPVVFHLVRKRRAEPTYHLDGRVFLKEPALETHIDLLKKPAQSAEPADLFVRFTRPPDASDAKPFAWKMEIEGRNGSELAETEDEFMALAPGDGYRSRIVREHAEDAPRDRMKIRFYVRNTARRFFAAVEMQGEAYAPFQGSFPAKIIVVSTVNPNNSPELEYDPELDIREVARRR